MKQELALVIIVLFLVSQGYSMSIEATRTKQETYSQEHSLAPKKLDRSYFGLDNDDIGTGVEYTLPEIKIANNHKIETYYPYFYKTHIIEYQDSFNYKELSNNCIDLGCQWCDIPTMSKCLECRHGWYLYNDKCYISCPNNYSADIFKKACIPLNHQNTLAQIVYLKAFTVGSCKNVCGMDSIDCSCRAECVAQGNCCSDYHDCEHLQILNLNRKEECSRKVANCELCSFGNFSSTSVQCSDCKKGYYLRNGECVSSCFPSDKILQHNKICMKNQDCRVENCSDCVDGNASVCKQCMNGYYMFNNQCLLKCPNHYRADRINWACLEVPVFAWYWIFPSTTSCLSKCGQGISGIMDCSCSEDCFRYANCCQDIEDYCPQFIFWQ